MPLSLRAVAAYIVYNYWRWIIAQPSSPKLYALQQYKPLPRCRERSYVARIVSRGVSATLDYLQWYLAVV